MPIGDFRDNAILAGLKGADRTATLNDGELVELEVLQNMYRADEGIKEVFFPLGAVLSVVVQMEDGSQVEVGTIGREGMSGIPLVMGSQITANDCFCQVPGKAWKMSTPTFHRLLNKSQRFRERLNLYSQGYVNMLGQMVACNRLHSVYERCSRWLLMTHDRVLSDKFPLSQEFLATMLGSRRSGVSIAAGQLQKAGFIHYVRGCIEILDRGGLESVACECYAITRDLFGDALGARTRLASQARRT